MLVRKEVKGSKEVRKWGSGEVRKEAHRRIVSRASRVARVTLVLLELGLGLGLGLGVGVGVGVGVGYSSSDLVAH